MSSHVPHGCSLYAVLKADAYGHGLREAAAVLSDIGCRHFAVESPQEAITLRNSGIEDEILLMNPIPAWMAEQAVRHDLSVSVIHRSILEPLEEAAEALNNRCRIHVNMNLGLNRMGISTRKVPQLAKEVFRYPHLKLEGLFGQPHDAATAMDAMVKLQSTVEKLKKQGINIPQVHFANSITFLRFPEARKLGARLGILLYGVMPPEEANASARKHPLKPVMSLTTRVVQIQHLPKGSRLGYHAREKVARDSVIGVLPLGYYHGLDRKMTKNGSVLIRGQHAFFSGSISMNASMVDITDISGVRIGDEALLFGTQHNRRIELNDLALRTGTIAAELMMRFGGSVSRKYKSTEKDVSTRIDLRELDPRLEIRYIQTVKQLPGDITFADIVEFLQSHMKPFHDSSDKISSALDYALASSAPGKGFLLLVLSGGRILGALVTVRTDTGGFIPENVIVYLCVHKKFRNMGLGSRLIRESLECTEGDIKLHVEKNNPAVSLYKKLGFTSDYLEMRYMKGDPKS